MSASDPNKKYSAFSFAPDIWIELDKRSAKNKRSKMVEGLLTRVFSLFDMIQPELTQKFTEGNLKALEDAYLKLRDTRSSRFHNLRRSLIDLQEEYVISPKLASMVQELDHAHFLALIDLLEQRILKKAGGR